MILNVCMLNNRASQCINQKLVEVMREIGKITIVVGHIKNSPSVTDRAHRQKISKDMQHLNNNMDHFDIINFYRTLHVTTICIITFFQFFSSTKKIFIKTDHMPGDRIIPNQFNKTDIL